METGKLTVETPVLKCLDVLASLNRDVSDVSLWNCTQMQVGSTLKQIVPTEPSRNPF